MLSALAAVVLSAGCGTGSGDPSDGRTRVVATTTQLGDMARQVGGGRVEVDQLLKPNSDPHGYEPRPSDAIAIGEADVVLRSGGEVDEWLSDLIDNAGGDAEQVSVGDRARTRATGDDPHWWQDPRAAIAAAGVIGAALAEADPSGADEYSRRAAAYARELRRLDSSVAACIEKIPDARRKLVTTHDALGGYAARYGLDVVGALIPSRSSQAQPSAGETAGLVDQIKDEEVMAIFPESSLGADLEDAVARETGAKVGGALWADTLGPEGSSGATYVDSIASNTEKIVSGLTGGAVRCRPSP